MLAIVTLVLDGLEFAIINAKQNTLIPTSFCAHVNEIHTHGSYLFNIRHGPIVGCYGIVVNIVVCTFAGALMYRDFKSLRHDSICENFGPIGKTATR